MLTMDDDLEGNEPEKPTTTLSPHLDYYYVYRKYIEHQDGLVNQRLNRLFLAHASLLSVAAVVVSKAGNPQIDHPYKIVWFLSSLAIFICVVQFIAIKVGLQSIATLARQWELYLEDHDPESRLWFPGIIGGGSEANADWGRRMTLVAPCLLAFIWLCAFSFAEKLWP